MEVTVDGEVKSLRFSADAVEDGSDALISGDAVTVAIARPGADAPVSDLVITSIEKTAAPRPVTSDPNDADTATAPRVDQVDDQKYQVMIPDGPNDVHFSKKAFIESGSRFDFDS